MMQVVQFINLTNWSITLTYNGSPILDNLKPAESKKSLIITPDHESSSNSVQILKDGHHANIRITQSGLTKSPIIVFKSEEGEYGGKVLLVDGMHASNKHIDAAVLGIMKIGRLLGKVWWCKGKQPTKLIAREAESPYEPEAYALVELSAL